MRMFVILLAGLLGSSGFSNVKSIVFDLDGIVLFHANETSALDKVIQVQTDASHGGDTAAKANRYRVADGFPELIEHLHNTGWKVHFFSFGNETRNRSALSQIRMRDGRTVLDTIERAGGKVFSNRDGLNLDPSDTRTEIDTSLPKEQRPKIVKSLAKVLGAEAPNAFLVEDIMNNTAPGERNDQVIYVPYQWAVAPNLKQVKFLEDNGPTLEKAQQLKNQALERISDYRFKRLRDRMYYLAGLLEEAERREKETKVPLKIVLERMQWRRDDSGNFMQKNGERLFKKELMDSHLAERGKELLSASTSLSGKPVAKKADCVSALSSI